MPDAIAFLAAGGVISLPEWLALDDETRRALAAAGARLAADRIATLASAIRSEKGAVAASRVAYGDKEVGEAMMIGAMGALARRGR